MKLWNGGGQNALNDAILRAISARFGAPLSPARGGYAAAKNVFIDMADRFAWPDAAAPEAPPRFCMALRDQIGVLADGTARTVTEIMSAVPTLNGASNQKASALVRQLVEDGAVKRELVKRKAYFSLA